MAASGVVHSGKTSLAVLEERDHVVARAWEDFVSGSGCGPKLVRDVVIESWQRCRTSQVNLGVEYAPHLATDQVPHLRQRNRQLLQAAAPTLVQAADVLAGTNSLMLITDPNGVVLEAAGDAHTVHAGMDIALMQGGRWTETDAVPMASVPLWLSVAPSWCMPASIIARASKAGAVPVRPSAIR